MNMLCKFPVKNLIGLFSASSRVWRAILEGAGLVWHLQVNWHKHFHPGHPRHLHPDHHHSDHLHLDHLHPDHLHLDHFHPDHLHHDHPQGPWQGVVEGEWEGEEEEETEDWDWVRCWCWFWCWRGWRWGGWGGLRGGGGGGHFTFIPRECFENWTE